MPHAQDQDEELAVVNLVNHAIVACADSPFACATNQAGSGWRTRIPRKEFDYRLYSSSANRIELAKLARGRW